MAADWALDAAHPITSILAASHDGRLVVVENDVEVADGPLIWDGGPLGSHVYVLQGAHEGVQGMQWAAMTWGGDGQGGIADLNRVRSTDAFLEVMTHYVHPGMLFVLTDVPLHPDRRSGRDFVIMS